MYIPPWFEEKDSRILTRFIRDHPFATLVSVTPNGPLATHLPLELMSIEESGDPHPILLGHVARANPHWRHFASDALAIFHGPHAYISPSWYVSDRLVPTWNYAAVHVYGRPRVLEDPIRVRQVLDTLVERFESSRPNRWVNSLELEFMNKLQSSIVAFEFPIDRMEGKVKLGQNHQQADQEASLAALSAESGESPDSLAAFSRSYFEEKSD